ncbi:SoxR reducing system RseC family protein [Zoogloea sp. LCSB751]|uniref:SoxR reducing system RseC family protein n=1 Tax=Zoogloea sp. LCSB751 TaxID=1965277 RepID=UPI0009A47CF3|nr:SoxR reducing system RseC family protein [Zoogloea sp. LCSB751]
MRVNGVVQRLDAGYAWVDVSVAQGCGRCNEPGGCGGVNLASPFAPTSRSVRVINDIEARPGESVGVVIDDRVPLQAALCAYGWPVLGVIAGAVLGAGAAPGGNGDLLAALGALGGGLVAGIWGRKRSRGMQQDLPMRLERGAAESAGACGQ